MGWGIRRTGRIAALLLPFALAACQSLFRPGGPSGGEGGVGEPDGPFIAPTVGGDPTVRALACDLDHLEKHIEWYGSVTAKVPDVWGQARLTQYRDEFEKAMSAEIANFAFSLNGSESRSDQSYFASATALSFAVQPKPPVIGSVTSNKNAAPSLVPDSQKTTVLSQDPKTGALMATQTNLAPPSSPKPATPDTVKPLDVSDPSTLVSATDTVISRTPPTLFKPGFATAGGSIGLEPTEFLAQKKRYLDFLNQLRRENEGDDTADSPGYSLNLLRIPVSVLPGKKTEIGYAAEVTMSLNPILGTDLLPMTFRNLLTNDIENQLGFPMTQILGTDQTIQGLLTPDFQRFIHIITRLNDYASSETDWGRRRLQAMLNYLRLPENVPNKPWREAKHDREALARYATDEMKDYFNCQLIPLPLPPTPKLAPCPPIGAAPVPNRVVTAAWQPGSQKQNTPNTKMVTEKKPEQKVLGTLEVRAAAVMANGNIPIQFNTPSLSFANGLDNRTAFPTSQLLDVYGPEAMFDILYAAKLALKPSIDKQKYAHLPDVQAYLREEVRAAYEFLKKNPDVWVLLCDDNLVQAIRSQRWDDVTEIRQAFRKNVAILTGSEPPDSNLDLDTFDPSDEPIHLSRTTGLAWALIVDAALLNDRLIRDMKETASAKGKPLAGCDHWCQFFLPDPAPECRQAFNEYVKLRWPIHVFALDPYNQEQNIADSLSTRRETQLALSIAFTNGQINAKNLTKYTRRLEAEYETISLNRTHIGFSHGENTFGWRFYPRYQTPDTPSNFEDLFRNQFIGGPNRNQLLRERRLEPGIRECVAIVMMPSFVPYVNVDTVSNWFPITNPKHKCLDTAQAMRLSRTVQTIKVGSSGVKDACNYRDGEYERLLRRADQLDARLPTQTLTSPVPILNTLGGFEMFSNGTTDLAPELFGWYGAPGIDPDADMTTLFLVGDHFSPLRTRVIVGNQVIDYKSANQSLLSRQVIQVTFVKGAYTLPTAEGGEVRIHLATPYGVTRELAVPVSVRKPTPRPGVSVAAAPLTIQYAAKASTPAAGMGQPTAATDPTAQPKGPTYVATAVTPEAFKLKWVGLDPTAATVADLRVKFVFTVAGTNGQPPSTIVVPCDDGARATLAASPATDPLAAANGGDITICTEDLKHMAADLFLQKAVQDLAASGQLASGLTTTQILVTAINPADPATKTADPNMATATTKAADATKCADQTKKPVGRSILTNDQLTITFKIGTYCKDCDLQPSPCPKPADPAPPAPKPAAKAAKPSYTFSPLAWTIPYCKAGAMMDGKYRLGLMAVPEASRPKLKWIVTEGVVPPEAITAEFEFTYDGCKLVVPVKMAVQPDGTYTTVAANPKNPMDWSNELVFGLFVRLNPFGPFTDATNPLTAPDPKNPKVKLLQLTAIHVTPQGKKLKPDPAPMAKGPMDVTPAVPKDEVDLTGVALSFDCQICDPNAVVPPKLLVPKKEEPKKKKGKEEEPAIAPFPVVPQPLPVAPPVPPKP